MGDLPVSHKTNTPGAIAGFWGVWGRRRQRVKVSPRSTHGGIERSKHTFFYSTPAIIHQVTPETSLQPQGLSGCID